VKGIGLRQGAIASSIAHDHHNLVVIGADDRAMMTAARTVAEAGGGLSVAMDQNTLALASLPIAGLMSDQPLRQCARKWTMFCALRTIWAHCRAIPSWRCPSWPWLSSRS